VQLDVVLTAHHMGHFSYKACAINVGEVASQECFDSNPLTFVEDVLYGSLPDQNYPNRAYIPKADSAIIQNDGNDNYKFSHRFRLPEGLSGDLVLLQWYYITGNSCLADEGYLNYNFPAGFEPKYELGVCNSIPSDGRGVPEQVSRLVNLCTDYMFCCHANKQATSLNIHRRHLSSLFSFGIVLKSEFRVIVQATPLLHHLPRLLLLPRQLLRPLPPPHRIQAQLQPLLQRLRRQVHHLHLLQAVLLKIMLAGLIILAPMACAAVSGAIVVLQKHTVENAAKATVMGSLLHHLVQAHLLQVLQQAILLHLLGLTTMLITEKTAVSLPTLGTGKLVLPMSKLMLTRTLLLHLQYHTLGLQQRIIVMLHVNYLAAFHFVAIKLVLT
jgi:hypothetical protein